MLKLAQVKKKVEGFWRLQILQVVVAEKVTCIRGLPLQVLPHLYSVLVYVSTDLGIYVRQ